MITVGINWDAFGAISATILGLATIAIAVISFMQSNKIKTLTDVVTELSKSVSEQQRQSKIWGELLYLEQVSRVREIQPFFVKKEIRPIAKVMEITIWNEGQPAFMPEIFKGDNVKGAMLDQEKREPRHILIR